MNTEEAPQAEPAASTHSGEKSGVAAQVMTLVRALIRSPRLRQSALLVLGVVLIVCAKAGGQIRLNIWQRDFYEAVEQRNVSEFLRQLPVFAAIAGVLLTLVVGRDNAPGGSPARKLRPAGG